MPTRAAAAREAAFIDSSTNTQTPSIPSTIPRQDAKKNAIKTKTIAAKKRGVNTKPLGGGDGQNDDAKENNTVSVGVMDEVNDTAADTEVFENTSSVMSAKRKRVTPRGEKNGAVRGERIKGGWDELPHNIGKLDGVAQDTAVDEMLEHPTKRARSIAPKKEDAAGSRATTSEVTTIIKSEGAISERQPASRKRASRGKAKNSVPTTPESSDIMDIDPVTEELKREFKEEYMVDAKKDIVDGIKKEPEEDTKEEVLGDKNKTPKKKRTARANKVDISDDVQTKVEQLLEAAEKPVKKVKKGKKNPYGLTPGETPFPDFIMPTAEACQVVKDLLSEIHGRVEAPKEIPAPSLEVTGCGEVPSVLDALIRTRLSASTTSVNAGYAFAGLVERYGILKEGTGAGSVDWNKVRESNVEDIEKAIKKGGLAKTKSKSIKEILEMVYKHNTTRSASFIEERKSGIPSEVVGSEKLTRGQKDMEVSTAEKGILSLDYMHGLTADEAMIEFIQYPGIGVKTASCVILFCLRRPSFAVDTHVWRFCKWLKWVPEGATRDQTFSHCEVRIPDDMKYALHQLFIRHGKTCGRCRAATGEGSEGWDATVCPIEKLVERTGKRKAGGARLEGENSPVRKSAKAKVGKSTTPARKGKKGKQAEEWDGDSDAEDTELEEPELDDDDDELDDSEVEE